MASANSLGGPETGIQDALDSSHIASGHDGLKMRGSLLTVGGSGLSWRQASPNCWQLDKASFLELQDLFDEANHLL